MVMAADTGIPIADITEKMARAFVCGEPCVRLLHGAWRCDVPFTPPRTKHRQEQQAQG